MFLAARRPKSFVGIHRSPDIIAATRSLFDAVTTFIEQTLPAWRTLDATIATSSGTDTLDFWPDLIEEIIGLDEVRDLVELAQWSLATITGGTISDDRAETVVARRLDNGPFVAFAKGEVTRMDCPK